MLRYLGFKEADKLHFVQVSRTNNAVPSPAPFLEQIRALREISIMNASIHEQCSVHKKRMYLALFTSRAARVQGIFK